MLQLGSYKDFLNGTYRRWVPTYEERHDHGPSEEILARPATFFAYTDYGGAFCDRVACDFLREHAPDEDLLWQYTVYNGMNLLYLGPLKGEFPYWTFPEIGGDFLSYHDEAYWEAESENFKLILDDMLGHRKRLVEWAHNVLLDCIGGHYSMGPDGQVDVGYERIEEVLRKQWPLRHER